MAQPLRNITVAAPGFFGINTQDSPLDLNQAFAAKADNCVIDKYGRVGARNGWVEVSTNGASVLGTSRGIETIFEYVDRSGDVVVISAGNNKVFKGTTTLVDITPAGYTPTGNNWKCVNFNNHIYMVQKGHVPLIGTDESGSFVLEAITSHAHAPGIMPLANEALAAFGKLWVADVIDDAHTLTWSDTLNGAAWSGGATGSLDLTLVWPTGYDEITALAAHNGFLIIFGKKSIIIYTGATSPATMTLQDTIEGVGCIARDSLQNTGSDLLFLSDSGLRSLGRVIQEKSSPIGDISKNVRNDLKTAVAIQINPVKSIYSEDEAFYLLSFSESNTVFCFDMRGPLDESGAHRVTTWTAIEPLALAIAQDGSLYIGKDSGIAKYSGYIDGTESYQLSYFSNPLDFDSSTNLKFLKKFNLSLIGSNNTPVTLNWGYDYNNTYSKQNFNFSNAEDITAEFGLSEYNTLAQYSTGVSVEKPSVNASGSGSVVTIGIEAQINDAPFSIQKIDIHALLGRLI